MVPSELDLYNIKWWDNRWLPPDVATGHFLLEWARASAHHQTRLGYRAGTNFLKTWDVTSMNGLRRNSKWAPFTRMRQFADSQCMPYPDFWSIAYRVIVKLGYDVKHAMLFESPVIQKIIAETYGKEIAGRVLMSDHLLFRGYNYRGHKIQRDYFDFLTKQVTAVYGPGAVPRLAEMVRANVIPQAYFMAKARGAKNVCR